MGLLIPVDSRGDMMVRPREEVVGLVVNETGEILSRGQHYDIWTNGKYVGYLDERIEGIIKKQILTSPLMREPDWVEKDTMVCNMRYIGQDYDPFAGKYHEFCDDLRRIYVMLEAEMVELEQQLGLKRDYFQSVTAQWQFLRFGKAYGVKAVGAKIGDR